MTFASGYADGLETVAIGPDGSIAVGGFVGASIPVRDLKFKSAGQVEEGHPFVAYLSTVSANGSEAPEMFDWFHYEYQSGMPFKGSAKAIRIGDNGDIHALCGMRAAIMVLNKSGQMVIKNAPGEYIDAEYQASDLELIPGGGYMLTGLTASQNQRKSATNEKVSKDLKKLWRKSYGNYPGGVKEFTGLGIGDLVIDECWGIMSTKNSAGVVDGHAIACGTGIENCNGLSPSKTAICNADPRLNWRSLVIATDLNGSRVWSRMDTFPGAEGPSSSAAEYIFPLQSGGIGVITDEAFGMGFLELAAPTGHKQQCSAPALAQSNSKSSQKSQTSQDLFKKNAANKKMLAQIKELVMDF